MTTDTRTTLNLPADMTRLIDNYWHAEQLRSRNEAIRELLRRALETKSVEYALRRASDRVSDAQPAKEQRR